MHQNHKPDMLLTNLVANKAVKLHHLHCKNYLPWERICPHPECQQLGTSFKTRKKRQAFYNHDNKSTKEYANGEYLYNLFKTVIQLTDVCRQTKLEILESDSIHEKNRKQDQND